MAKSFFLKDDPDFCFSLEYWREYKLEYELEKLTLIEAKPDVGGDYFYCNYFETCGERGGGCGNECTKYQPRNGKNGICKHWRFTYEPTNKIKII